MKKILLAGLFLITHAYADYVPKPMEENTNYNWKCDNNVQLHLFVDSIIDGGNALYINNGSASRGNFSKDVVKALIDQDYESLSGQSTPPNRHQNIMTFHSRKGKLSVLLWDTEYKAVKMAYNCVANFKEI